MVVEKKGKIANVDMRVIDWSASESPVSVLRCVRMSVLSIVSYRSEVWCGVCLDSVEA